MEASLPGYQDAIDKTVEVAGRCSFEFKTDGYKFPEFEIPEGTTLDEFIKNQAKEKLENIIDEKSRM